MAGDLALLGIGNVGAVVVECGQGSDDAAHDRHRVRIAPEAAIEGRQLLVQHRVAADRVGKFVELSLRGKLAVQQQIADFHEVRLFGQLADGISAMEQHALVAVDICQRAFAATGRLVARIVGEGAGLSIKLADVDYFGADAAFEDRQLDGLVIVDQRRLLVRHDRSP